MKGKNSDDSILFVGVISFILSMIISYLFWNPHGLVWMSYLVVCPVISGVVAMVSIIIYKRIISKAQ